MLKLCPVKVKTEPVSNRRRRTVKTEDVPDVMRQRSIRKEQVDELAAYLMTFPITLWVTVTFRKPVSAWQSDDAIRRFRKCLKKLNKPDRAPFPDCMGAWIFAERNPRNLRNIHLHALVCDVDPALAPELESVLAGVLGKSEVEAYDGSRGAAYYLAEKNFCTDMSVHRLSIDSRSRETYPLINRVVGQGFFTIHSRCKGVSSYRPSLRGETVPSSSEPGRRREVSREAEACSSERSSSGIDSEMELFRSCDRIVAVEDKV